MGKLNNFIGIRQKEISQKIYARPAYLISHKTECKVYQETKCGVRTNTTSMGGDSTAIYKRDI